MLTISPNSPNVSDNSSWCTSFDKCPTQSVVLQTINATFAISLIYEKYIGIFKNINLKDCTT